MPSVLIFGAGSIGNHLTHAALTKKWDVSVMDIDEKALNRMKDNVYPSRYGKWDEKIKLINNKKYIKKFYDYIFVGTPPNTHLFVAIESLKYTNSNVMMIEKPLTTPEMYLAEEFYKVISNRQIQCFVGYTHAVSKVIAKLFEIKLNNPSLGKIKKLTVNWKEHWEGIFNAHPWLRGPEDSYLGQWKMGGGAIGEHSHGLNLWLVIAKLFEMGKITQISAKVNYVDKKNISYDSDSKIYLTTEKNLKGVVFQDVITMPPEKNIVAEFERGKIEIEINKNSLSDELYLSNNNSNKNFKYKKNRADDFIQELNHIEMLGLNSGKSPISLINGLETMLVISASHMSGNNSSRTVNINYSKGYTNKALRLST